MNTVYMRFPGGREKALTLSYDDGVETDIRLISIMKQHGLKGTFNINSGLFAPEGTVYPKGTVHRRMSLSQVLDCYRDSGMEVALHGYRHPFWNELLPEQATYDILRDRERLEDLFGTPIRGAAFPYGTFNEQTLASLKACGVVYCRAVKNKENFSLPTDFLQWQPTCHHSQNSAEMGQKFLDRKIGANHPVGLFYLWGHSYEFDGSNNWEVIEAFAELMGNRDDIWYATNIEIYEYNEAFSRLIFTLDGSVVKNPCAMPVWFSVGERVYTVQPGETVRL